MTIPLALLLIHFVADFLLQSDWMALNKSKNWRALSAHVTVYSACFLFYGGPFMLVTWVLHFLMDAVTSRITSKLWFIDLQPRIGTEERNLKFKAGYDFIARMVGWKRHWFFVVIGFDQLIHFTCLALTYRWLIHG